MNDSKIWNDLLNEVLNRDEKIDEMIADLEADRVLIENLNAENSKLKTAYRSAQAFIAELKRDIERYEGCKL